MLALMLAAAIAGAPPGSPRDDPTVRVRVDSTRHEVIVVAGWWDLPNMPPMTGAMHDHGASHDTPVQQFTWPVDGWFRGFKLEVRDRHGRVLPRRIMHHLIAVNYDRRQLLYPAAERLFGAGTETADATIPATIGVPLPRGTNLGFYVAWHNDTGEDLEGVELTMRLEYSPANLNPRPLDVMPLYMDVNLTVGGSNSFDVPPGRSEKGYEFTLPIGGRLIGYSGHLHDYGVSVRLEDVETGKVVARVTATRDRQGKVSKVSRSLPGLRGAGVRLKANHRYRVVGTYDNPTGETLVNGAMAHIAALFAPDNVKDWPAVDLADPTFQTDLASLELRGAGGDGMDGHDHGAHDHADHQH
ncbi:MAG: hypothetical protein IPK12_09290 [Gemmatimonadetes bacterium]|nr:hypothetical protein [Gemmatimonadota bacterium]